MFALGLAHAEPASKNRVRLLATLNFISLLIALTVNALAVLLPLNGKTTGELSDQNPTLLTPAGFTFSIWSVIYIWLIIFTVILLVKAFRRPPGDEVNRITHRLGVLFIFTCLLNASWLICWHYEKFALSVLVISLLLLNLIWIHFRLE